MKYLPTALALLLLLIAGPARAQIWQPDPAVQSRDAGDGAIFVADDAALRAALEQAGPAGRPGPMAQLDLPLPDGSLQSFELVEAPIMAPGLAAPPQPRGGSTFRRADFTAWSQPPPVRS